MSRDMKAKLLSLLVVVAMLLPIAGATNFEISVDDPRDVSNPDVDIVKAWTTVEGGYIVFHVKVAGKINEAYSYLFAAYKDGENVAGVAYQGGVAFYTGESSGGYAEYSIDGDTLSIKMPYGMFSSWDDFAFTVTANDGAGSVDYAIAGTIEGGDSGNDGNGDTGDDGSREIDPSKETPTDKSISVKITKVEYNIEKVDNGQRWYARVLIEGTTSGVDHVSLCYVIYYKDGTYDVTEWIKGPMMLKPGSFMGNEIIKFVFNSMEGNWNKWKFEVEGKYPVTDPTYEWAEEKEVDKVVIYARAFKDASETKWNQAKYETKPQFTSEGAKYEATSEGGDEGGGKTPGFEAAFVVAAMAAIALLIGRRRK